MGNFKKRNGKICKKKIIEIKNKKITSLKDNKVFNKDIIKEIFKMNDNQLTYY